MQCCPFFLLDNLLSVVLALGHRCDMVGKLANPGAEIFDKVFVDPEEEEDFSFLGKSRP